VLCATSPHGAGQSATGWFHLRRAKCSPLGVRDTPGQRGRGSQRQGRPGWDGAAQWDGRSFACFFSHTAHTCTAELDPGFAGEDGCQCATTPLGREGAVLQRVLLDEAIALLFQCTGHCGRATGAGAISQAVDTLGGKAMDPLAQRGIGKGQRIRNRLEALAFDDVAHRLGTAEDASLFRLFQEDSSSGEGVIGKV
jgi:hypothetical protein